MPCTKDLADVSRLVMGLLGTATIQLPRLVVVEHEILVLALARSDSTRKGRLIEKW